MFLMTRAAELGRGTYTAIDSVDQVDERMRGLFEKLESPAVTNLTASFAGAEADVTPAVLPDLYRGEPVVMAAKLHGTAGTLEIGGKVGDRPWTVTLPLAKAAEGRGLSKIWARRKIADAEVARSLRRAAPEETDGRILALALEHQLVTRLTSLVAVDATPSRPEGVRLSRADIPLDLPAGWDFDTLFGPERSPAQPPGTERAQKPGGTPIAELAAPRHSAPHARPGPAVMPAPQDGVQLPKTATDAELRMLLGALLGCASLLLLAIRPRRRKGA
jgi:Ca-activated chloride channel family protein